MGGTPSHGTKMKHGMVCELLMVAGTLVHFVDLPCQEVVHIARVAGLLSEAWKGDALVMQVVHNVRQPLKLDQVEE